MTDLHESLSSARRLQDLTDDLLKQGYVKNGQSLAGRHSGTYFVHPKTGKKAAIRWGMVHYDNNIKESVESTELYLHGINSKHLHPTDFIKNASRKMAKGIYDHSLASKLYFSHAHRVAKDYEKTYRNGSKLFSATDKREAAAKFADFYKDHATEMIEHLKEDNNPAGPQINETSEVKTKFYRHDDEGYHSFITSSGEDVNASSPTAETMRQNAIKTGKKVRVVKNGKLVAHIDSNGWKDVKEDNENLDENSLVGIYSKDGEKHYLWQPTTAGGYSYHLTKSHTKAFQRVSSFYDSHAEVDRSLKKEGYKKEPMSEDSSSETILNKLINELSEPLLKSYMKSAIKDMADNSYTAGYKSRTSNPSYLKDDNKAMRRLSNIMKAAKKFNNKETLSDKADDVSHHSFVAGDEAGGKDKNGFSLNNRKARRAANEFNNEVDKAKKE